MSFMQWDESYSVGIVRFDEEHKKLFAMINEYHDAFGREDQGANKEELRKLLHGLLDYTKYHFGAEEHYFDKYGYPESAQHEAEHKKLISELQVITYRFETGRMVSPVEVSNLLRDWLDKHIKETDQQYTGFFHSNEVK